MPDKNKTVVSVEPLPNYHLLAEFKDGTRKKYDMRPLFKKDEDFRTLLYVRGLFELVYPDDGGWGIVWNEDLDLACEELYDNGVPV